MTLDSWLNGVILSVDNAPCTVPALAAAAGAPNGAILIGRALAQAEEAGYVSCDEGRPRTWTITRTGAGVAAYLRARWVQP